MSAVPLSEVKRHLGIPVADVTRDADLQKAIDSAEATIADKAGPLAPQTVTERIEGGRDALIVQVTPATALTSVTPQYGGPVLVSGLLLDQDTGIIRYTGNSIGFPAAWYDVVYTAGYATVPADLIGGIKELVRHLWKTQRGGVARRGEDNPSPGDSAGMPASVAALIDQYEADEQGFA